MDHGSDVCVCVCLGTVMRHDLAVKVEMHACHWLQLTTGDRRTCSAKSADTPLKKVAYVLCMPALYKSFTWWHVGGMWYMSYGDASPGMQTSLVLSPS